MDFQHLPLPGMNIWLDFVHACMPAAFEHTEQMRYKLLYVWHSFCWGRRVAHCMKHVKLQGGMGMTGVTESFGQGLGW